MAIVKESWYYTPWYTDTTEVLLYKSVSHRCPTVTTEIDDAEAESSFDELQSWTRYIAQHPGQRA